MSGLYARIALREAFERGNIDPSADFRRVPEGIVFLKQDQHGEISHIAENARDGEPIVGGAPQGGRATHAAGSVIYESAATVKPENQTESATVGADAYRFSIHYDGG